MNTFFSSKQTRKLFNIFNIISNLEKYMIYINIHILIVNLTAKQDSSMKVIHSKEVD